MKLQLSKMGALPQQIEVIAYRLVQECFNNIGKHAHARHVNISLASADGILKLTVEDNGVGFNVEEAFAEARILRDVGNAGAGSPARAASSRSKAARKDQNGVQRFPSNCR